jgi:acetyl-CoA acyltransferase 1
MSTRYSNVDYHHTAQIDKGKNDDVVIVAAVRTPLIRASNQKKPGQMATIPPAELLQTVLEAALRNVHHDEIQRQLNKTSSSADDTNAVVYGVTGMDVQDLCVGNVLMVPSNFVTLRMAAIASGLPAEACSLSMVNRQCASGLQAISDIANRISAGEIDIGIGAGVESMSMFPMHNVKLSNNAIDWSTIQQNKDAMDCILPMGITSDTIAVKYNHQPVRNELATSTTGTSNGTKSETIKIDMDRSTLDAFAAESHRRAFAAQNEGIFDAEICPVRNIQLDDGIRSNTTVEGLSKLRPIFTPTGVTTAGNSSQLTDGAAAIVLMRRSIAVQRHIPILAVWKGYTCCGVPPAVMGIGPSVAIPELLRRLNLNVSDLDSIELNEAFASQALYCIQELQLDLDKVNPHGGAIALGHPLGATGTRLIVSLINTLHRQRNEQERHRYVNSQQAATNQRPPTSLYGCTSMCVGTGMGAAAIIEVEPTATTHFSRSSL